MFRKMRRFGQLIPESESIEILQNASTGILAVQGDNGYPYTIPMNYAYVDGKILMHGANSGHKIDAIRSCDKVSFCVIDKDDVIPELATTAYRSVVVFGRARLVEDRKEMLALTEKVARKYCGNLPIVEKELGDKNITLGVIEITPEHITGKEGMELKKLRK